MYRSNLKRSAFTLIELLVVMAIIAVLASLILAGVMYVRRMGPEVQNRNDILQLSAALQRFYEKYKFYPPSHIKLCSKWSSYGNTPLDQVSVSYLGTIWPNLDRNQTFNWAGGDSFPEGTVLHGDQCLVFFLGGMPTPTLPLNVQPQPPMGFFNNPANPTAPANLANPSATDRVKFFSFDGGRCVNLHEDQLFPSYLDAHAANNDGRTVDAATGVPRNKAPFLYFSSGKRPDGYTNASNQFKIAIPGFIVLPFAVAPYSQPPGSPSKFYNPTSYQLISAGPNGGFGAGGPWVAGATSNAAMNDNVSNFYDRGLGY